MPTDETPADPHQAAAQVPADPAEVRAWEEVAPGRFLPRRVRGSFRGGKLG